MSEINTRDKYINKLKDGLSILKKASSPNLDAIRFYENLIKELENDK